MNREILDLLRDLERNPSQAVQSTKPETKKDVLPEPGDEPASEEEEEGESEEEGSTSEEEEEQSA